MAPFIINYFTKIIFEESNNNKANKQTNKQTNKQKSTTEGVLKNQSSAMYCSKLLRRTFLKIPFNKFTFGKISG